MGALGVPFFFLSYFAFPNESEMDIIDLIGKYPELAKVIELKINAQELFDFAIQCVKRAQQETEGTSVPEDYLTPEEFAKTIKISQVTLWAWDKKGITKPLYIGKLKRYRRSDLERIFNQTGSV